MAELHVIVVPRHKGLTLSQLARPHGRSADSLCGDRLQIRQVLAVLIQSNREKTLVVGLKVSIGTQLERTEGAKIQICAQCSLSEPNAVRLSDRSVVARVIEVPSARKNFAVLADFASNRQVASAVL